MALARRFRLLPPPRCSNKTDPLTDLTLGAGVYVTPAGVGYDPALLVRYVLQTGARHLPASSVPLATDALAEAFCVQAASGHTGAALQVHGGERRLAGPAALVVAGVAPEVGVFRPVLAPALARAQATATVATLPATFFDSDVRVQVELALAMCELDAVDHPQAAFNAFVEGPWLVLRIAMAGYLTVDPLRAAEAAVQIRTRLRACVSTTQRWSSGEVTPEDGDAVLYHPPMLHSVVHAITRLCGAVLIVLEQPAHAATSLVAVLDPGALEPPSSDHDHDHDHHGGGHGEHGQEDGDEEDDEDDEEDEEEDEEEDDENNGQGNVEVNWDTNEDAAGNTYQWDPLSHAAAVVANPFSRTALGLWRDSPLETSLALTPQLDMQAVVEWSWWGPQVEWGPSYVALTSLQGATLNPLSSASRGASHDEAAATSRDVTPPPVTLLPRHLLSPIGDADASPSLLADSAEPAPPTDLVETTGEESLDAT